MVLTADDRAYLAAKGFCRACGNRPAMPGLSECMECRERTIQRRLKKKNPDADVLLCPSCGKNKREPGTNRCKQCASKPSTNTQKMRRLEGLCIDCGKVPPADGRIRCKECAEKALARRNEAAEERKVAREAAKKHGPLPKYNAEGLRLCHDCKAVYSPDYRCPDCLAVYRKQNGVSGGDEDF